MTTILNTSGSPNSDTDGNALNGAMYLNPGGVASSIQSRSPTFVDTPTVLSITDFIDDRLDDPRYYTGDAAT